MEQVGVQMIAQGANAFGADMASATKAVAGFGASVDTSANLIQDAAGRWRTSSGRFASDAEKAAAGVETVVPAAKSAGDAAKKAGADAEKGGRGFDVFGQVVIGALREVGKIAVDVMGQAARATAGFVKDSIGLAGDFQQNMLEFQSVAGRSVDTKGLDQFKGLFLSLGKELPVSTSEVQQAAIEMVKGGIDPAIVAAGGLKQNIQFAAAAMKGDLVGAAEISAKILGGWAAVGATAAEKAAFLTHATDQLTKAANASSVDVKELSLGIFNSQGIAKAAGVSFDDLTTTLAELAPRFASSSEAGTSLKNMIVRLNPQTKSATGAMEGLGLYTEATGSKFYDAQGNFVGFSQASQLLQESLKGLTKEQQATALQTIFGNDAMSAASALAELGAHGYADMAAALTNANGVSEAAALKQQGYNTALENAKGSVEALQITIGSALLPVLTDLMNNVIAPGVNTLTTFASAVTGDKDAFAALSPTLQPLAAYVTDVAKAFEGWQAGTLSLKTALDVVQPGMGKLIDTVQSLTAFLKDNISTIAGVVTALGSFAILTTVVGWVTGAIGAVTALGTAFTAAGGGIGAVVALLGGPVTLAIAGVALAIGALVVAWQNDWGGIQEKTAAAWAVVEPILATAVDWLQTNIPVAVQAAADVWTHTLQPALAAVGGFLNKNVFPILQDLSDIYIAAAIVEVKALSAIWEAVLWPALKMVWSFLKDSLIPIIAALVDVNIAVLSVALRVLTGIWRNELQPAIAFVSDYISTNFGPTIKEIGGWLSSTFGPTLQSVTKWLGDATGGFTGISDAIQGTIRWLKDLASSISNLKLPDWLVTHSPTPFEVGLRGIGDALATEVIPGVQSFGSSLVGMGTAAAAAATDITTQLGGALKGTSLINDAKTLGKNAVAGFVAGIEGNLKAIDRTAGKVATHTENAFGGAFRSASPSKLMIPYGVSVVDGLIVGMKDTIPALNGLIDQMGIRLNAKLGKISSDIQKQISDAVTELQDKVKDAQDSVANLAISGFGATANIDRQKLSNLDALSDISAGRMRDQAQAQLEDAEREAAVINDPKTAADYYELRSKQIIELAKLQDQINTATDATERQRLIARFQLVEDAQQAERQAQAAEAAQGNDTLDLVKQIQEIMSSSITAKGQKIDLPGLLEDPIIGRLFSLMDKLTSPAVSPAYIGGTAAWQGNTTTTNLNMPVYTNMSPSAIQQSAAIAGAML